MLEWWLNVCQKKTVISFPVRFDEDSEAKVKGAEAVENINYFQVANRILRLNKREWFSMIIAILSAVFIGASFPIFAILFAEFYGVIDTNDLSILASFMDMKC